MAKAVSPADWLRTARAAQLDYSTALGWPVVLDVDHRRLFVTAGTGFDALSMPASLGRLVADQLRAATYRAPAVTDWNGAWWTFLTQPAGPNTVIRAGWGPAKIRTLPRWTPVAIPTRRDTDAGADAREWRWMVTPSTQPPPDWTTFSAAVQVVLQRGRSRP